MNVDLMMILGAVAVPLTLLGGWYLKNKIPNDKLQNDWIPVMLWLGNFVITLAGTVQTAEASFYGVPVALTISPFLAALFLPALQSIATTGIGMFLHALGKLTQRKTKEYSGG